jgi:hypothetical protein
MLACVLMSIVAGEMIAMQVQAGLEAKAEREKEADEEEGRKDGLEELMEDIGVDELVKTERQKWRDQKKRIKDESRRIEHLLLNMRNEARMSISLLNQSLKNRSFFGDAVNHNTGILYELKDALQGLNMSGSASNRKPPRR